MRMIQYIYKTAAFALTVAITSGQSVWADSTEQEKIIRMGITAAPSGVFLPQYNNDSYNGTVTSYIYESLVGMDENADFTPKLAESWEISEDSRTVTFHLRDDVEWHDGESFTADDVKFTYELMSDPDYAGFFTAYISQIEGYEEKQSGSAEELSGVNVIDDYTISVTTTDVYASFLYSIAYSISILPEHYWSQIAVADIGEATEYLHNPIGTGPFKISEFIEDQYVTLVKNEVYYVQEPLLDKLIITVVNTETAQAQVLNGEIDYLSLYSTNPDDIAIYEDAGFNVELTPLNAYQQMVVNTAYSELNGIAEFRQALAYAINREGIVAALLYGYGNVANCSFREGFWAYPDESELLTYDYDPDKALELLQSIEGIIYENGVLYYQGEPIQVTLTYPSGNLAREGAAVVIQENLKDIGIEVTLDLMEFATLMERLEAGEFELALFGNGAGVDPDTLANYFKTGMTFNYSRFSNERVDALFEEGLLYLDNEERAPYYQEIAVILNNELPTVYLYNWEQAYVVNPGITGMTFNTFGDSQPWLWDIVK